MPDFRQNFNLPYPVICKIIEKIDGDDSYELGNTCKFLQRMCYREQIPNIPSKILGSILRKLSPMEIFYMAQTSQYMWNLTKDICKRQVNVLSIDEYAETEFDICEESKCLSLAINHTGFKALVKNLIVTDTFEIYDCKSFKPSLRKGLNLPVLRYTKLDLVGCSIDKDDLGYFLHPLVIEFNSDCVTVKPNLQFEELLEMLKNVEIMRIDITNLKFTPDIKNVAMDWKREKPIKSFGFMKAPKTFSTFVCIDFIEKFGGPESDFNLSFSNPNRGYHERYHRTIQKAIDEAQTADRSHNGLAGVTRWRCEEQIY
uniref:F-box domain-containing protein n=1 Tax=Panagrolaimus sp. PS1159 TaxID=55785 RepID=A0AC35G397_9BILA